MDRQPLHRAVLEGQQLLGIETGGGLIDPLQRKALDQLVQREVLPLVVQRPAQQGQVVEQRRGQKTDLLVEIDDHRIEGGGVGRQAQALGDRPAAVQQLREIAVLPIFVELPLAEFVVAARLGHVGQVGVLRQLVAQGLGDEHLPRRVGEVLLGADHVGDLEIVIVDHAGQVV